VLAPIAARIFGPGHGPGPFRRTRVAATIVVTGGILLVNLGGRD
jgi:hypothetical protein